MAKDFRLPSTFFSNHRTKRLLRIQGKAGVLALLSLWAYAAEERTKGRLEGMTEEDILTVSEGANVTLTPEKRRRFLEDLVAAGFLVRADGCYALVGWETEQPWAFGFEERSKQGRKAANTRWMRARETDAGGMDQQCPYPIPSPPGPSFPIPPTSSSSPVAGGSAHATNADDAASRRDLEVAPASLLGTRSSPSVRWDVTDELLRELQANFPHLVGRRHREAVEGLIAGYGVDVVRAGFRLGTERALLAGATPRSVAYFRGVVAEVAEYDVQFVKYLNSKTERELNDLVYADARSLAASRSDPKDSAEDPDGGTA